MRTKATHRTIETKHDDGLHKDAIAHYRRQDARATGSTKQDDGRHKKDDGLHKEKRLVEFELGGGLLRTDASHHNLRDNHILCAHGRTRQAAQD